MTCIYEKRPLKYFFKNGTVIETDKYTIDNIGFVRYAGREDGPKIDRVGNYAHIKISHNNKRYKLHIARIIASTFIGPPPDAEYTADHKNRNRDDNHKDNIRWFTASSQRSNQVRSDTRNDALIVIKGDDEMISKEWLS